MNEYNFNIEEIEESGGMNNTNNMNNMPSPKKPKKNIALKFAASLMAMALVSAGSIEVYRHVADNAHTEIVSESSAVSEGGSVHADAVNMIKTEESSGKVLTTKEVVKKVMPSVVGVESTFEVPAQSGMNGGSFFNFGFGGFDFGEQEQTSREVSATGTGVIVTENGYIVTNAHVIYDTQSNYGLAKKVRIVYGDDTYDAEVIGYDDDCDLAVLKIDASGLPAAEFGDSDKLELGEDVTAIGNPLGFDLMNTVTTGIVSGLNRNITINDKSMTLIQTDAAINSGNSGGPLINEYGQVIGINSAKISSSYYSGGASVEGICFAIPSNKVSDVVDDLMSYGYVTGKPQLGITCQDVTETISEMYNMPLGVCIVEVTEGSACDKAGLQKGDIITEINGVKVKTAEELTAQKNLHDAGDEIELKYYRSGSEYTATVTLDEKTHEA